MLAPRPRSAPSPWRDDRQRGDDRDDYAGGLRSVLDFCGLFEVFSVTCLDEERWYEETSSFDVLLVIVEEKGIVIAN